MSHHKKHDHAQRERRARRRREFVLAGIGVVIVVLALVSARFYIASLGATPPVPLAVTAVQATSDKEITHGDTSKKQLIFTFDGGASAESADQILAVLAKHRVKGTFFLTGKFIDAHPDLVRQMVADGHEIFNHTYDHPHLTALSEGEISTEFRKVEQSLQIAAGISPKPFFRAPYGDRDSRVLSAAFKDGYESVYWSIDAHDWEESNGITADDVRAQILDNASPGTIYLMHLGDSITGSILDDVFTKLEAKGYKLVSLTQGL